MGSWLIALAASARGAFDPIAVRLPSVLAVLGTTLLIYGYGRSFLGRPAALAAAAGFAAMPEILQMGRLAESDAVFTFFLGGVAVFAGDERIGAVGVSGLPGEVDEQLALDAIERTSG